MGVRLNHVPVGRLAHMVCACLRYGVETFDYASAPIAS